MDPFDVPKTKFMSKYKLVLQRHAILIEGHMCY